MPYISQWTNLNSDAAYHSTSYKVKLCKSPVPTFHVKELRIGFCLAASKSCQRLTSWRLLILCGQNIGSAWLKSSRSLWRSEQDTEIQKMMPKMFRDIYAQDACYDGSHFLHG